MAGEGKVLCDELSVEGKLWHRECRHHDNGVDDGVGTAVVASWGISALVINWHDRAIASLR